MKKSTLVSKWIFFVLVLNLIFSINVFSQLISGTHYIGPGQEYETINEAVDSLESIGVDGPTIMKIKSGTYNEQVKILSISGTSPTNTVTFESEAQHVDSVSVFWNASTESGYNYVFFFGNCDYVTVQYMKISNTSAAAFNRVFFLNGDDCFGNKIKYNQLIGKSTTSSSNEYAVIYMYTDYIDETEIIGNDIVDGSYPVYLYGNTKISNDVKVNYNKTNSYYGMYLWKQNNIEVIGNEINSSYGNGIELRECHTSASGAITVLNNKVSAYHASAHAGIYLNNSDGSGAFSGLIANNVVFVTNNDDADANTGINLTSSDYHDVFHNTVYLKNSNSTGCAFYANGGGNIVVKNNLFAVRYHGYALNSNNGTNITASDYNNFYTSGNYLAYWGGAVKELADLQGVGYDASSKAWYPSFLSIDNISGLIPQTHWIDDMGDDLTGTIDYDIDSVARPTSPSVGAYQYTASNTTTYSGPLTIQAAAGTFTSFSEAADSLNKLGVSGAVTISVETNTYNENFFLIDIPGVSAANTITFQSATGDSTDVTVEYSSPSSTDNYVVYLNGTDYITFKEMSFRNTGATYARIFRMNGLAHDITITNNVFIGSGNAASSTDRAIISSTNDNLDNLTITNNSFTDGDRGVNLSGISEADRTSGLLISNNQFSGHRTNIGVSNQTDFEISDNLCEDFTYGGITTTNCSSPYKIHSNQVYSDVNLDNYANAISTYNNVGSGDGGLIYNNFVYIEDNDDMRGIRLYSSGNQSVYNNSVNVVSSNANSKAFFYDWSASHSNNIIKNNNFVVKGSGYPMYLENPDLAVSECDYNNYYTSGSYLVHWDGTNYGNLTSLNGATGEDANSVNYYHGYFSDTDLHTNSPWLDSAGVALAGLVDVDIDGDVRDATYPDIGADEYSSTVKPYAGEYTIGATGDFLTFNEALDSLIERGVNDTVIFKVQTGTYTENLAIPFISGISSTSPIIFESETGNAADVKMAYSSTGSSDNFVVIFNGAKYITFRNMTLDNDGVNYARVFSNTGSPEYNTIDSCILEGSGAANNSHERAVIYAYGPKPNYFTITNNIINAGSYAIYLRGPSVSDRVSNLTISNNEINGGYMGIYLLYYYDFEISENIVNDFTQNGIYIQECFTPYSIASNKLSSTNVAEAGINIYNCSGTGDGGLVYNNFVHVERSTAIVGIYIYRGNYSSVYNNSVNVVSANSASKALQYNDYYDSGDNIIFKNNNAVVDGPGYPLHTDHGPAISECDYNNYYTSGSYIAHWHGTNHSSIATLSSANSMDDYSVNYNPVYTSSTDLHSNSYWIDGKGTPIALIVTDDIDGEARDGANPDIGADEFTSTLVPYGGEYTIGASGRFATFNIAIDSLAERGVIDTVIFKVESGFYTEQFVIPQIANVSSNAIIIFESETGNAADVSVIFDPTSGNNYIVKFAGADYITFRNLNFQSGTDQYARIFNFSGSCENITIADNILSGRSESSTVENDAILHTNGGILNNLSITNNTFSNGSFGIFIVNNSSSLGTNLEISNNSFSNYHQGIYANWFVAPKVDNNQIVFLSNDGMGMNIQNCSSAATFGMSIQNNQIYSDTYANDYGAMYINACDANPSFPGLIANNVMRIGINGTRSIGMDIHESDYLNFYHNTVNITGNAANDHAFVSYTSNGINIVNNNFVIKGDVLDKTSSHGYPIYIASGTIGTCDYNNYYTAGNIIGYWLGTNYGTLAELQAGTSKDVNSVNYFPGFRGTNNLKMKSSWLDGAGTPIATVTEDIEGTTRDGSNPDIGAYEYTATLNPIAEGTYTVGTFGGDYPSLDSLVWTLMEAGIAGPVTFELLSGSYTNTNITIKDIPGTSSTDTVVIQSQSGDPSNTTISHTQESSHNYMLRFAGTDHLTIKDLAFNSGGTTYARILYFEGNSQYVKILGNVFNGVSSTSVTNNQASVYIANDYIVDNLLIKENTFIDNSYGVYFGGNSSYNHNSIKVVDNIFNNQYRNVYIQYTKKPYVYGNQLIAGKQEGIYLYYCDDDINILNNEIFVSDDSYYAIYLNNCDGSPSNKGLIANNFVGVYGAGGTYGSFGIKLDISTYQRVYHNSIEITGTKGSAYHVYQGGNNEVANNVFVNSGTTTYSYNITVASSLSASDYNDLYSIGTNYIYYNGTNYTTLADYQLASSFDLNSLSVNPVFTSSTDFHLLADSVVGEAAPLTSVVPFDFDGETRDVTAPDMGADEFSCAFFPPPVVEDVTVCTSDSIPSLYATGSNIKWYSDPALTTEVWSANEYDPGHTTAGVYTYYVTQSAIGCTSSADSVVLTILQAPVLSADITHLDCQGTDYGAINLTVTGSTASPFIYEWSNEEIYEDIDDLNPGDYTVTVEDLNGCTEVDTFTVTAPADIILDMIIEDTQCDTSTGSATVVASGGEAPYEYQWTTGDTVTVIDNLYSGIYVVTVSDNRGCEAVGIGTVSDYGAPIIADSTIIDVSCYGNEDGQISLTVSTDSVKFEWSNGDTTAVISDLSAGPYEVIITDTIGCRTVESFMVDEPDPIKIGLNITETSCGQSNGAAEAIVTGGTVTTDYIYSWSTGDNTSEITGLTLGVYNINVIDDNGCSRTKYFSISEIGAPSVIVDSIYQGTCGNSDGAIYISAYGYYTSYTYNWSNASTNQDLIGVNPGTYNVTVSDAGGCDAVQVATIEADQPEVNPICMVSVDSATNHNEVIWEKQYTTGVDHYNIYKETTQSGVYAKVGEVPEANESVFEDVNSDVMQRSWRYKISVVDVCGIESELSKEHKTMHLTINLGLDNAINLIWNHYEGFDYETYYIHRKSNTGWELIDSVPSNLNSYTDADPIADENLYYMIEIKHPTGGCDPAAKARRSSSRSNITNPVQAAPDEEAPTAPTSLETTAITDTTISLRWVSSTDNVEVTAYEVYVDGTLEDELTDTIYELDSLTPGTTYAIYVKAKDAAGNLSAASNTINPATTSPSGIGPLTDTGIKNINLYPNPNQGEFIINIETSEKREVWYEIFTINGRLVTNEYIGFILGEYESKVDMSDQGDGMYIMKIYTNKGIQVERILLSK
ncbi:NosD domain-containing protein [Bacteroidota bacterium]